MLWLALFIISFFLVDVTETRVTGCGDSWSVSAVREKTLLLLLDMVSDAGEVW